MEDDLSIECACEINLHYITSHARCVSQRLERVLGQISVCGAMAEKLHLAAMNESAMSSLRRGDKSQAEPPTPHCLPMFTRRKDSIALSSTGPPGAELSG
jgi:hypothetical protein